MFNTIMSYHDQVMFLLRVVVGVIFVWHAWPKMKMPEPMAQGIGWSKNTVRILGLVEFLAGLGVIFGVLMEWSALAMVAVMLGALYHKVFKWHIKFWARDNTGWEFDLLLLVCALLIMAHGPGQYGLTAY